MSECVSDEVKENHSLNLNTNFICKVSKQFFYLKTPNTIFCVDFIQINFHSADEQSKEEKKTQFFNWSLLSKVSLNSRWSISFHAVLFLYLCYIIQSYSSRLVWFKSGLKIWLYELIEWQWVSFSFFFCFALCKCKFYFV